MKRTMSILALLAVLLAGCGGGYSTARQQEFIDKCIIEAGPQSEKNNVAEYCRAKWRQSQRANEP